MRRGPRLLALSLFAAALLAGCGEDSSGQLSPLVNTPSAAPSTPVATPSPRLLACDGTLGNAGDGSTISITGACNITVNAKWECSAQTDDMYAQYQDQLANGTKVYLSINVEFYKQPGFYGKDVHVFLQLGDANGVVDGWSNYNAAMTVADGVTSADLPKTALTPDSGTPTPQNRPATIQGHIGCHPPAS